MTNDGRIYKINQNVSIPSNMVQQFYGANASVTVDAASKTAVQSITVSTLKAEGEKRSSILIAEGEKESAILRAEAEKESQIKKAEGEAEAILKLKQAEAQGIELIKNAKADEKVIALKSLEALKEIADGKSTKIIVPSDLQNIATIGTTVKEMLKDNKE